MSGPSVVFKAQLQNGDTVLVRDYLDSYEWLNANTPADARVLSWWDYGYQITGIANRTTLADGNTWRADPPPADTPPPPKLPTRCARARGVP